MGMLKTVLHITLFWSNEPVVIWNEVTQETTENSPNEYLHEIFHLTCEYIVHAYLKCALMVL